MHRFLLTLSLFIISIFPVSAQEQTNLQLQRFRYDSYVDYTLLPNYFKESAGIKKQVLEHLISALNEQYLLSSFNLKNTEETSDAFYYELINQNNGLTNTNVQNLLIKARLTLDQTLRGNHATHYLKLKLSYTISSPEGKRLDKRKATTKLYLLDNGEIQLPFILSESQYSELFKEAFIQLFQTDQPKQELEWQRAAHPRYNDFIRQAHHFQVRQRGGKGFFKSKNTYHITSADQKFNTRMSLQLGGFLLGKSKKYLFRKDWKYRRYQFEDPEQTLEYVYHSDKSLKKVSKETGSRPRYRMQILKEEEHLGGFNLAEFLDGSTTKQITELFGKTPPFSVMAGHYLGDNYHIRYIEKEKIIEVYKNGELVSVFQENLSGKFHRRRSMNHELFVKEKITKNTLNTMLRLYLAFTIARSSELKQIRYGN